MPSRNDGDETREHEQPLPAGHRVGHYEILDEIGRGGMGIVYRARDAKLGRRVALKCPLGRYAGDARLRRLMLREVRTTSRLSHPNIVQIFEAFEVEGIPWFAMQLVEGQSLRKLITSQKRLPVEKVLRYGIELTSALQEAHSHNILHRDIKPTNVLVAHDDRTLLTDFGLARFIVETESTAGQTTELMPITAPGAVVGTPQYMSPEQALGKELDARSDIFSLGTVLYEMCTGEMAFSPDEFPELLDAIIHREPRPISRFTYEVPEELERIIRKTLAKLPDERYQGAGELLADLRALDRQLEFEHYSDSHDVGREGRSSSPPWGWIGLLAFMVTLVGLGWWWQRRDVSRPVPRGQPIPVRSTAAWEGQPALSPEGQRLAYVSNESGNLDIYVVDVHGGRPLRLTEDPASDREPCWFPDGSALAFASNRQGPWSIWRVGQFGGGATLLFANAVDPAISPDGKQIAFRRSTAAGAERIWVSPLDDPARATMLDADEVDALLHRNPAWSPDGNHVCFSTEDPLGDLWIVPVLGGPVRRLTSDGLDSEPTWSYDGRYVFFTSYRDGRANLWRTPSSGGDPVRFTFGLQSESQASICDDGSRLAYSTEHVDQNLALVDLATGQTIAIGDRAEQTMPALAPDGKRLVYASDEGGHRSFDLWEVKLEDGQSPGDPRQLTSHPGNASHPTFSPDGNWIAYYRIHEQQRDIWIVSAEGGEPIQFTQHEAADLQPAWSPDGASIAFQSHRNGSPQIWVASCENGRRTGPPRCLTAGEVTKRDPVWSPDGRLIAFVGRSGGDSDVWLVPVDGSELPWRVTTGARVRKMRWSPTNDQLLVSGRWGAADVSLAMVTPEGGPLKPFEPRVIFGQRTFDGTFDISADGRLLVYSREEIIGSDIGVLEAEPGTY